jgi:hypothetical protein
MATKQAMPFAIGVVHSAISVCVNHLETGILALLDKVTSYNVITPESTDDSGAFQVTVPGIIFFIFRWTSSLFCGIVCITNRKEHS